MKKQRIALLGFGTVGSSLYRFLTTDERLMKRIRIVAILIKDPAKPRPDAVADLITTRPDDVFRRKPDIVLEMLGGEEPAYGLIKKALARGIHVITANKVVAQNHFFELSALAAKMKAGFLYEASVAAGMPVIHALQDMVATDPALEIRGILNASTNYCLSRVQTAKIPLADAIAEAKAHGYLEADPDQDLSGADALRKLLILVYLAFGVQIPAESCRKTALAKLSDGFLDYAAKKGLVLRQTAVARRTKQGFFLAVEPVLLPKNHPFAAVEGIFNVLEVDFATRGTATWIGRGAGDGVAAQGMLSDLVDVLDGRYFENRTVEAQTVFSRPDETLDRYLLETEAKLDPSIIEKKYAPFVITVPIRRETLDDLLPGLVFHARIEKTQ